MNYMSKMSETDLEYICGQITGKDFKKYYQNNPKGFNMIRPGFRATSLSEAEAEKLALRNASTGFISDFICKRIGKWMDEIQEAVEHCREDGYDLSTALFITLGGSVFQNNVELYFRLQEKEYSEEFIELCVGMHQILNDKDDAVEQPEPESTAKATEELEIDRWENKEKEYQQKIEKLEGSVHEYAEKLNSVEQEKQESEAALEAQKTRLDELEHLNQMAIFEPDLAHDKEYPYSSLCEVYTDWEGHQRLRRITDITGGVLLEGYAEDAPGTSVLYPRGDFSNGLIGVWDWKASPKESGGLFYESLFRPQFHAVEIAEIPGCHSVEQMVEILKMGVRYTPGVSRILFAFQADGDSWMALYCETNQLEISDQSVKVKDSIYILRKYVFPDSAILAANGRLYYRGFNLGMPREIVHVNDPLDTVKKILVERINWTEMKLAGFHKAEYQELHGYMESMKTDALFHEIAVACECSDEEGKTLLDDFLQRADDYLNGDDFESGVFAQLVSKNVELMEKCEAAIRDDWEKNHAHEISEAEDQKKTILQEVKEQEQYVENLKGERIRIEQRLEKVQAEIQQQQDLADGVKEQVNNQIAEASRNASDFISKMLFELPVLRPAVEDPAREDRASFISGAKLTEDVKSFHETYIDVLETLGLELDEAGVGEKFSDALAAYLYSAYIHRTPIIAAGPNGKDIADALSVSLNHRLSSVLNLNGKYDADFLEQCVALNGEVIIVQNPFCNEWVSRLPDILADRRNFYILNVPCAEELMIEPKSLYNFALPLLTEPLIVKRATREYVGGICGTEFKHYERDNKLSENRYNKMNTRLKMGPLLQNVYRQLTTDIVTFTNNNGCSLQYDVLFEMLPYAFATGNLSALGEILADYPNMEKELSKEMRQLLELYLEGGK